MFERIVVPLDGSPIAAAALEQAEALAEKLGSSLILVRVVHTLGELAQSATPSVSSQAAVSQDVVSRLSNADEHANALAYLANEKQALDKRGIPTETHVKEGAPGEQIVKTARESTGNLIVMTAYGAGGAHTRHDENVFGGVADEVLRRSKIPVLMIRP